MAEGRPWFDEALGHLANGDVERLAGLLDGRPELAKSRDEKNATLLIRLVDWPGLRPRAAESARVLLQAGAEVDARRDDGQGTPLAAAVCTKEADVAAVLLEHGADPNAPCGFEPGSVIELVQRFAEDLRYSHELSRMEGLFRRHTDLPIPPRPRLGRAAPVLSVADVENALVFYRDRLGFRVSFEQSADGGKLVYAIVDRGGSEIHLARRSEWFPEPGACHLFVDPAAELYREYQAAGVEFEQELTAQPWGLEDFVLRDPDGNRLEIGGPIDRTKRQAGGQDQRSASSRSS